MKEIQLINSSESSIWDEFILSSGAGPYLLYGWNQAVEKAYGHKTFNLMAFADNGIPIGALPLALIKPPLIKGSLVSLPFCDYGGIISTDDEASSVLIEFASQLADAVGAKLEIRTAKEFKVLCEKFQMGVISHKVRMILELPHSSQDLLSGFKSKLRSQLKKPVKEGLVFKTGSHELLDDFYEVFRVNMRDLGSPVHSKKWIASVLDNFSANAMVGVVYKESTPVGGGIILLYGDTVTIPWASTLAEYNKLSPNMLLYWGFLEYAADNGFKYFDFGRSTPDEGTYRFKEQWGAVPHPLYWYGEGFSDEPETLAASGGMREKIAQVWAKLPQGVTDTLGPVLRRYISL
jgi:FemAB-related protein (PEP-CTERM system-associated)